MHKLLLVIIISFSGSASIPLELMTCPRNLTQFVLNSHFARLSVTLACNRCILNSLYPFIMFVLVSWARCHLCCIPHLLIPPGSDSRFSGIPLKQKRPHGVMNVVNGLDSQACLICQKADLALSFVKTLEPANLPSVVSTAGSG